MDYANKTLADALAAQYVAGTLRGAARRRFEALLPGHPALRTAVADWQARLMPLTAVVVEQAPPAHTWERIAHRLWPEPAAAAATPPLPWWRGLAFWRGLSGVATVAALALGLLLTQPGPSAPPVMVVLQPTGNAAGIGGSVVASFSADGRAAVARPVQPVAVQSDRTLQLWWATATGKPQSLGLIRADGVTVLRPGALPGGLQGSALDHMAVSVEPPGGSPTGQPTGPVVFYGKLVP
ncbi:MAG: anti-sigma factor [Burkholderiaceae bacterium]|jgi:anti-sigma-K factor RskA|nr:anti-sigma factor [Burkholderiaceae bacterium]